MELPPVVPILQALSVTCRARPFWPQASCPECTLSCQLWPLQRCSFILSLLYSLPYPAGRVEKEMAAHSSILAWKIPWTAEPSRLLSMGSQRVEHD